MLKYMIFTIELIQQRILHHEKLNKLKAINDLDVIQEFSKFMNEFSNEKNATCYDELTHKD